MDKNEILKTSAEYRDALKKLKPNIIKDKMLEEPCEDEDIQRGPWQISGNIRPSRTLSLLVRICGKPYTFSRD